MKVCKQCGGPILAPRRTKYCTDDCSIEAYKNLKSYRTKNAETKEKKCGSCGKTFMATRRYGKNSPFKEYCSVKCGRNAWKGSPWNKR